MAKLEADRRLDAMERQLSQLRDQLAGLLGRNDNGRESEKFRIAKVVKGSGTFPAFPAAAYWISFVDLAVSGSGSPGAAAVSSTVRSANEELHLATLLDTRSVAVGDLVRVYFLNQQWWILGPPQNAEPLVEEFRIDDGSSGAIHATASGLDIPTNGFRSEFLTLNRSPQVFAISSGSQQLTFLVPGIYVITVSVNAVMYSNTDTTLTPETWLLNSFGSSTAGTNFIRTVDGGGFDIWANYARLTGPYTRERQPVPCRVTMGSGSNTAGMPWPLVIPLTSKVSTTNVSSATAEGSSSITWVEKITTVPATLGVMNFKPDNAANSATADFLGRMVARYCGRNGQW